MNRNMVLTSKNPVRDNNTDTMASWGSSRSDDIRRNVQQINYTRYLRGTPPKQPLPYDPLSRGYAVRDELSSLERLAVRFPSVRGGIIEHGLWCRRCEYISVGENIWEIDFSVISRILEEPLSP
jgi:hypothetical protein